MARNTVFSSWRTLPGHAGEEHLERARGDIVDTSALFGGEANDEVIDQGRNVLLALAQWRHETERR